MALQQRIGALVFAAVLPLMAAMALADNPGKHPYYLNALADLRNARAQLERQDTDPVDHAEEQAISLIDITLAEIRRAAIDDGKDVNVHAHVDAKSTRADRFHKALVLLGKAREDVSKEEDMAETRGLQQRVLVHIADARRAVQHVISTALSRG
jgi:hypothetical protein